MAVRRMLPRFLLAIVMVALFGATTAEIATPRGKRLSMERAKKVATEVARADCERKTGCDGYGVRVCKRSTLRRVRCASRIEGVDAKGSFACERPVVVKRSRKTGKVKHRTRKRTCSYF